VYGPDAGSSDGLTSGPSVRVADSTTGPGYYLAAVGDASATRAFAWTDDFTGEDIADLDTVSARLNHQNSADATRFAIRIDGQWYATDEAFSISPAGVGFDNWSNARVLSFDAAPDAAKWRRLTMIEGQALVLGSVVSQDLTGTITGLGVSVEPGSGHQFVSRKTGHPIVEGLDPFHFSFWYDHERDRIAHLTRGRLAGERLQPITLTGKGIWYSPRAMLPSAAELAVGDGRVVLDQVAAAERMPAEPRAAAYLVRLLSFLVENR